MSNTQIAESSKDKLARLVAAARASKIPESSEVSSSSLIPSPIQEAVSILTRTNNNAISSASDAMTDKFGQAITYNEKQLEFVSLGSSGASCILIGAAGTGKTTSMKGTLSAIIQSGRAGLLVADDHKHLESGTPGIVIISFTRRAVANIRKNLPPDLQANCLTYHALMEYQPEYYEVFDETTGENKRTMQFSPSRSEFHPLPRTIKTVVIEEASMFSVDYFNLLQGALRHEVQFIFLGDIQQLPPVFGAAILGYKMLELPTVELTQVYRQALESPIIRLAHRILSGLPITCEEYLDWKYPSQLTIHPWKKRLDFENATYTIAKFLKVAIDSGAYAPDDDMVLIPFNKSCGSIELNKHIAQHMARKRVALVYEVVAGFNKICFSVGDKVLYDKEDAIITSVSQNPAYTGVMPQAASLTLDYWGFDSGSGSENTHIPSSGDDDIDFLLSQSVALGAGESSEDRVRQASHEITIRMSDSGTELTVSSASDINNLLHAYVLTVHKSQGSEFRKVFLMIQHSHSTMVQRELLYTAVTRAKEELYIICEPDTFTKGILNQRIKGNTLTEKAEYFKGKIGSEKLS